MEQRVTLKSKIEVAIKAIDDNKFQCIAVPNCDYVQKGKVYHGNFIRHVRVNHPDKLEVLGLPLSEKDEEPKPKRKKTGKLTVETTVKDVLLGTLQLTTSNALPLSYPEWVGIKTLVGPLWKAANLSINRKSLTELTVKASVLARELLAAEIKGRPLHLKMDSASRRSHHSFAVNAAFYKDGQIVTRSLVIKEMIISQTASNLCQTMVEEVIQKFGILPEQILTIAHDNGANMVASVTSLRRYIKESSPNLLTKELKAIDEVIATLSDRRLADMFEVDAANDEIIAAQDDEEIEEEPHKENDQENHEDNTEQDDNDEDVRYSDDEAYDVLSITSTRCAAHTCQLAVWDVLKKYSKRIENIKKLCLKTRLVKYRTSFATHKAHLPPIPGQTRWNSVYLMVKALREQKSFFLMLQSEFDEMNFSKHWASIELLCEALEPLFFLTVMLQKEHVPLSEFYTEWLICQAKLNSLTTNHLAKKLLNAMEKRLHKLTETPQFKACLYIDPRFNYIGSNRMSLADKEIAQNYLLELWKRLNGLEGIHIEDPSVQSNPNESNDFVEQYLNKYFERDTPGALGHMLPADDKILQQIKELELRPKVRMYNLPTEERFDIVEYWKRRRTSHHEMFRLATAILSAPSTQVTVERAFSGLKLVLTDQRQKLSDNRIQDLMILKLNQDLLPLVSEKLCADV